MSVPASDPRNSSTAPGSSSNRSTSPNSRVQTTNPYGSSEAPEAPKPPKPLLPWENLSKSQLKGLLLQAKNLTAKAPGFAEKVLTEAENSHEIAISLLHAQQLLAVGGGNTNSESTRKTKSELTSGRLSRQQGKQDPHDTNNPDGKSSEKNPAATAIVELVSVAIQSKTDLERAKKKSTDITKKLMSFNEEKVFQKEYESWRRKKVEEEKAQEKVHQEQQRNQQSQRTQQSQSGVQVKSPMAGGSQGYGGGGYGGNQANQNPNYNRSPVNAQQGSQNVNQGLNSYQQSRSPQNFGGPGQNMNQQQNLKGNAGPYGGGPQNNYNQGYNKGGSNMNQMSQGGGMNQMNQNQGKGGYGINQGSMNNYGGGMSNPNYGGGAGGNPSYGGNQTQANYANQGSMNYNQNNAQQNMGNQNMGNNNQGNYNNQGMNAQQMNPNYPSNQTQNPNQTTQNYNQGNQGGYPQAGGVNPNYQGQPSAAANPDVAQQVMQRRAELSQQTGVTITADQRQKLLDRIAKLSDEQFRSLPPDVQEQARLYLNAATIDA